MKKIVKSYTEFINEGNDPINEFYGDTYSTKNVSRVLLRTFMDFLNDKDVAYEYLPDKEVIDIFDDGELSREDRKEYESLLRKFTPIEHE